MASSATLTTLRERVLQQITNASSGIDHTPVSASSLTLTTMRDRVEDVLQDAGNAIWATGDIDEAIRQALEQYSRHKPNEAIGTVTLSADGREIDISSLTGLIRVLRVWLPYDSTDPGHPPAWVHFETWPGSLIYINDPTEPSSGEVARIWYTKEHTLNGLDAASTTTFPVDDESFLIGGAAAFAARFRAVELAEEATVDGNAQARLLDWAQVMMKEFSEGLNIRDWRQYSFQFDQNDVDEAIRWALHRYSEVMPDQTITTLTLAADGREVDISSITDYEMILRTWWDYDSTNPVYPPEWRDFEVWPGNILFIAGGSEPQSGDKVRVWYTRLHTISGLDSATSTTIAERDETLIVIGASAFTVQERVQDEVRRYVPRKLREWGSARIGEFNRGLERLAKRYATRHSGISSLPALDRWDERGDGWA